MIRTIYFIVLIYFLIGGIGFYFIDRKKKPNVVHKNRVKFIAYFVIINTLFLSITIYPLAFRYLSVLIIGSGFYELIKLFRKSGYAKKAFFQFSVFLFGILSLGFFFFGSLEKYSFYKYPHFLGVIPSLFNFLIFIKLRINFLILSLFVI